MFKSDHSIRSYNNIHILRDIRLWVTGPLVQFFLCVYVNAPVYEKVILMFEINKIQDAPCDSVFIEVLYIQMWPLNQKLPIFFHILHLPWGYIFALTPETLFGVFVLDTRTKIVLLILNFKLVPKKKFLHQLEVKVKENIRRELH